MKLFLATNYDWKNADWGIRILSVIFLLINLLCILILILNLMDGLESRNYSSSTGTQSSTTWPQGSQRTTGLNPPCSVESSVVSIF